MNGGVDQFLVLNRTLWQQFLSVENGRLENTLSTLKSLKFILTPAVSNHLIFFK